MYCYRAVGLLFKDFSPFLTFVYDTCHRSKTQFRVQNNTVGVKIEFVATSGLASRTFYETHTLVYTKEVFFLEEIFDGFPWRWSESFGETADRIRGGLAPSVGTVESNKGNRPRPGWSARCSSFRFVESWAPTSRDAANEWGGRNVSTAVRIVLTVRTVNGRRREFWVRTCALHVKRY